jgi:hypothetical protein
MRSGSSRLTLLQTFSALSLVLIAALGVTLGAILHARIEHRAVDDTRRLAITVARVGMARQLQAGEPNSGPLSPQRVADLDHWFDMSGLLRGKLYDRRGRIIWSDEHAFIGQDASGHEDVREAIEGTVHAEVEDSEEELGAKGRFFEVYVPIRGGLFESYMSYEPTAKAIASDTRTLFLALGPGLLLLWLVLFRVVARLAPAAPPGDPRPAHRPPEPRGPASRGGAHAHGRPPHGHARGAAADRPRSLGS